MALEGGAGELFDVVFRSEDAGTEHEVAAVAAAVVVGQRYVRVDEDLGVFEGDIACAGGYFELFLEIDAVGVFLLRLPVIAELHG